MKKIITISLIGLTLIAATTLSGCRYSKGAHSKQAMEKRATMAVNLVSRELNFSTEQKDQLVRIKEDVLAQIKEQKNNRETQKAEIIAMIRNNEISNESITEIFDQHMEKKRELKPFLVEKVIEFNNILTDQQRQKLADHLENNTMPAHSGKF